MNTTIQDAIILFDNQNPNKTYTAQEVVDILYEYLEQEKSVIIEAYNQGYRDGESAGELSNKNELDISKFDDANNYFITTFTNQ